MQLVMLSLFQHLLKKLTTSSTLKKVEEDGSCGILQQATIDSSYRRIVLSTGACRFFIGSEMEKPIETDLVSLSNRGSRLRCTPLEMTILEKAVTHIDFYTINYPSRMTIDRNKSPDLFIYFDSSMVLINIPGH